MIISYEQDLRLIRTLLHAYGLSGSDAACVAEVVRHSDFTGVYSHGLSRLILYIRQLENGSMNAAAEVETISDEGAVIRLDCHNGSGIVAVNHAYDVLLEKARTYGIAIATGMHSGNIGCGAFYGCRAARDNMIGIVCCNTLPSMAPFGGAEPLIGTNPIIVGVPAGAEHPIVLDISTSGVAMGKIQSARREGKAIPLGWATDVDGRPTTDPDKACAVLPIAGHKGYGLAVIVDVLSAVLADAAYGFHTGGNDLLTAEDTGFCIILIDPSHFMPIPDFTARVDDYIRMVKSSRPAAGVPEIFLPGEIEFRKLEQLRKNGLPVTEAVEKELCLYAAKRGLIPAGGSFAELLAVCL